MYNLDRTYQKCSIHRLFAKIYNELFQGHRLIVEGYEEVA